MPPSTAGRSPDRGPDRVGSAAWYAESRPARNGGGAHKRAARIARQIEADVIAMGWPVGASLGSEQALQARFGVSRSVLREAVRLVEHHQVARTRRGPNGGLFVTAPDAIPATRALVVYLEYAGATLDDLLGARLVLEPLAAGLCAQRVAESGVGLAASLTDILVLEEERAAAAAPARNDLHVALGELSGNPVLALFVDVLTRLTGRYADLSRIGGEHAIAGAALARTHRSHVDIVAAVRAGDAAAAHELSQGHLEGIIGWLHENYEPARSQAAVTRPDAPERQSGKLAERLSAAVRADIVAAGWRVGSVLGTEVQLLERYGVSRSVLREAIRLLEHHSVARMRRGPGGGLVVDAPEAGTSIDTIALFLEYRKPSRADLIAVRDAIEFEHVRRVTKRRDDVAVQEFLGSGHTSWERKGNVGNAAMAEFCFHRGLAELAGNQVLGLFHRIAVEVFRRQWTGSDDLVAAQVDVAALERAHAQILEAIGDGDDVLAWQRTRDHLETTTSWWAQRQSE